jgi:hypothetical protein
MRDYYEMLRRTAAILLSLATLADWVADRSRPVRWLTLWILQRAEVFASAYVAEIDPLAIEYTTLELADGHDEAIRLAATFRMFAAVLFTLVDQAQLLAIREPSEQPARGWLPGCRANANRFLRAVAALRPRYADTS